MDMFCRQCEQAAKGVGCTSLGVCGKTADVAILQDLLLYSLRAMAVYGNLSRQLPVKDPDTDLFIMEGLFTTVTNVNFDAEEIEKIILRSYEVKEKIKRDFLGSYKKKYAKDFDGKLPQLVNWIPATNIEGLIDQGRAVGLMQIPNMDADTRSLRELLLLGLKGMAAYADHAFILGKEDEEVSSFFYKGLAALADDKIGSEKLIELIMEFGKVNFKCLELLDKAHNEHFGSPQPTKVSLLIRKGPAIIVSGHDLLDLEQLLEDTKDKGINIYTHGEMLPAHGYPNLKKYKHLAGHFGGAWQEQQKEFDNIPAAILMTTNCIQKPRPSYEDRIFTTGLVAFPGVKHINESGNKKDFRELIDKALKLGGFRQEMPGKEIMTGFGHKAVLGLAGKIIEAVKAGKIRHFFLIGGCDGAKPGRNYYTEFAQKVPPDCVVLTLACGKFRFNKLDFGAIEGIPRLVDCGQCNDAYSAIIIASGLAEAFKCGINDLPLSIILSWYEQKAVCILLTLLSLGVKNIKLGPSLPAFVSPDVLKLLVKEFNISPVTSPDKDLKEALKD